MKKFVFAILVGLVFLSFSFSLGLAKSGKVNLQGEIVAVETAAQTITIQTNEEVPSTYTVSFPPDDVFGFTEDDIGSFVQVKGEMQEDGTILAEWVKPVMEEEDEEEGGKEESAYCSGKKETPHPAAIVLANRFDKEVEEIMGFFCDGFGIGQIYLALKTEVITAVDYEELLNRRADGEGWGEIWEEFGYKSKSKDDAKTPPGQDKDKDKDKDKDQDKDKDKDKDKDQSPGDDELKDEKTKKPKKEKNK